VLPRRSQAHTRIFDLFASRMTSVEQLIPIFPIFSI